MRVLIVEDDAELRESLVQLLYQSSHVAEAEGDPQQALRRAEVEPFDVVLCALRSPVMDGLTFLRHYRATRGSGSLVMVYDEGDEDRGMAALAEGASRLLRKPLRPDEVVLTLRQVEEEGRLRRDVAAFRALGSPMPIPPALVAESRVTRDLLALAGRIAAQSTPVVITGEHGTGKATLARTIHCLSPRRDQPFAVVDCASLPASMLVTELLGSVGGQEPDGERPGVFEAVREGSVLLKEVGELPLTLQSEVTRFLNDGVVQRQGARYPRAAHARLMVTSSASLEELVEVGALHPAFAERLSLMPHLHWPPLRERKDDIPALVGLFVRQAAARLGRRISITPQALALLTNHTWVGNVRELHQAVERAVVVGGDGSLDSDAFALEGAGTRQNAYAGMPSSSFLLRTQVEEVERAAIRRALDAANGNRREAAHLLGISLRTLFYKLRRVG